MCRYEGDSQVSECAEKVGGQCVSKTFVGTGQPADCVRLLERLVYKVDDPSLCQPKPCAIGSFYQPTLPPDMDFHAVGAFIYALEALEALDDQGRYLPQVGFDKAFDYCQKVFRGYRLILILLLFTPSPPSDESDTAFSRRWRFGPFR